MAGVRNIPTDRARSVLDRLVELNRITGDLAPSLKNDQEEDPEAGLLLTPVRRRRLYEDVVQQLQSLISSGRL